MSAAKFNQIAWQFNQAPNAKTAWNFLSAIHQRLRDPNLECCQRMRLKALAHGLLRCFGP